MNWITWCTSIGTRTGPFSLDPRSRTPARRRPIPTAIAETHQPGAVEGHHRQFEALVFLGQEVLGRDARPLKEMVAVLDARWPILSSFLSTETPGRVGVDDEGADAAVTGLGVGLREHREVVGVGAVGDGVLGTADDVLVRPSSRPWSSFPETSEPASGSVRQKEASFGLWGQLIPRYFFFVSSEQGSLIRAEARAIGHERGADAQTAPDRTPPRSSSRRGSWGPGTTIKPGGHQVFPQPDLPGPYRSRS